MLDIYISFAIFDLFGSGTINLTEDFPQQDRNGDGLVDDFDIPIAFTIRSVAPNRPPTAPDLDNKFFAWYAQDDWKITPNFTLNIGLRYELDTNTKNLANFGDIFSLVRPFLSGDRGKDRNNFAPRIGFNWNPYRLDLEKGPAPNDERHRFTFAGVFDLPSGFQLSPIYLLASGVPIDIRIPSGATRVPVIQRNAGGRQFRTGSELNAFINQFNATAPAANRLPLVRDDLELGDSFQSFDLRLAKSFRLSERLSLQAIAETFNLFNVTNIRGVNNVNFSGFQNALGPSFGTPLQTAAAGGFGAGGPRAFQFAARVQF